MSESITVDGKEFISAKRAAKLCGYTPDYVGQLARAGKVLGRRVDKAWFISQESILLYKEKALTYKPVPPKLPVSQAIETIVGLDGVEYISAKRAAKVSHYNPDYITQLARTSKVPAQHIAGKWYVAIKSLLEHKAHNDALLAAMQAAAAGVVRREHSSLPAVSEGKFLTYRNESTTHDLFPNILSNSAVNSMVKAGTFDQAADRQSGSPLLPEKAFDIVHRDTNRPKLTIKSDQKNLILRPAMALMVMAVFMGLVFVGGLQIATKPEGVSAAAASTVEALSTLFSAKVRYDR